MTHFRLTARGLCLLAALGCSKGTDPTVEAQTAAPLRPERALLAQSLNASVTDLDRFRTAPLYRIDVSLNWDLLTYTGTQTLTIVNAEKDTLTELNFFLYPNSAGISNAGEKHLSVRDVTLDGRAVAVDVSSERLRVPLAAPLPPGGSVTVAMVFDGVVYRLPAGSGDLQTQAMDQVMQMVMGESTAKGGYGVFSFGEKIMSLALWYPILAAYDDRGWDLSHAAEVGDVSYFDVANYDVTISAPADVTLVTTGTTVDRHVEGNQQRVRVAAGASREFTIEASKDFVSASEQVGDVTVTSWSLRHHAAAGSRVLTFAKDALALYGRLFGPYPYKELDVVEAPLVGGAGGVEFPGIVTVGTMFYAADATPGGPPEDDAVTAVLASDYMKDTLEFVVAHEVAHEWWNATVGSDSKRHPFVDEALANHSAVLYFENVHGKASADAQRELQLTLPYRLGRMVGAEDRPVDLPTSEFHSMLEYAGVVYGKGALFFDAMRAHMGDADYFAFLRDYYRRFSFSVATTDDLLGGMARVTKDPTRTAALMTRWLEQTHGDEDVGEVRVARLLRTMVGTQAEDKDLQRLLTLLDSQGAAEIGRLLGQVFSSDGTVKDDVDYGAIVALAGQVLGEVDDGVLGKVGRALGKSQASGGGAEPSRVLEEAAKALVGDDPSAVAAIEAAGTLYRIFDALSDAEDESEPSPTDLPPEDDDGG